MKRKILGLVMMGLMPLAAFSQDDTQWTLGKCIDYALEKNIQLQQNRIQLQESGIDVLTAKAALFPSLSFDMGHSVLHTPFPENTSTADDRVATDNTHASYNGNYSLNAQWTLWNGGKRMNQIKQTRVGLEQAELSVQETENLLKEEITRLFMQILYADESVRINRNTLETSEATYRQAEELFRAGSLSKADLAQLEAQTANDRYMLVSAENSLKNYKLQLKQLLELEGSEEMELVLPQIDEQDVMQLLPGQEEIYQTALAVRPEIQNARLDTEYARLSVKSAQSGYFPTISLSLSASGNAGSAGTYNWAQQMKHSWSNMASISLSVPIFDNRQNKSNVQKARLQYSTSMLQQTDKEKELYRTIETLRLDALSAQQEYLAAGSKLNSCMESFRMVNEQFSLGMKNTVELLTEKNNLLSAQQQKLQAKYMAVLNKTLLDFYAGMEISL